MINFKKLKRLLLVSGLFSTQVFGDCTIDKNTSGSGYTASGCTGGDYKLIDQFLVKTSDATTAAKVDNPVPGFYKTVDGKYVQCKSFGACEVITPVGNCSGNNGGKLSSAGLCLGGVFGSTALQFGTETTTSSTNYLVTHTQNDDYVFSFAKDDVNYYAVYRPDANSIVFNKDAGTGDPGSDTEIKDKVALSTEGKLIDRKDELCNINNSSGKYYTCTDGICVSYAKSEKSDNAVSSENTVKLKFTVDANKKTCSASSDETNGTLVSTRGGYLLVNNVFISYTGSTCKYVSEVGYYKTADDFKTVVECKDNSGSITCAKASSGIIDDTSGYNVVVKVDNDGTSDIFNRFVEGEHYAKKGLSLAFEGSNDTDVDYYKIKVTKDSMVLDTTGGVSYYIKDTDTPGKYNIYECSDGKCKMMKDTYLYEKNVLYNCEANGDCTSFDEDSIKTGYYNAGFKTAAGKFSKLIECTKKEGEVPAKCKNVTPSVGCYFDATQETTPQLIQCKIDDTVTPQEINCKTLSNTSGFYINTGNLSSSKLTSGLIQCDSTECKEIDAKANQVFVNAGSDNDTKQLIKCSNTKCSTYASMASAENNEYYINAGDEQNPIIKCGVSGTADPVTCNAITKPSGNNIIYVNANFAESGDKNQLIQCTTDGCAGKECTDSRDAEYYINAEASSSTLTNAVISCAKRKCEKVTPTAPSYYVGTDMDINGLIACEGNSCTYKSPFTSPGYYLNAGENRILNQTIICDANEGCGTIKVDLGVYVNASTADTSNPLIICDKEGSECVATPSPSCPNSAASNVKPGSYCFESTDNSLKFYNSSNSTAIAASRADNYYVYATVPSNVFPGMKGREIGSLFKVSHYYINRFYQSGIVIIDKNNKLVDGLVAGQTDITLFECDDSTKLCVQKLGCTDNTYMYDSENKKALFCNAGILENTQFNGYVVDMNRSKGVNHPYLIKCEREGKYCVSVKPDSISYFENSGYDFSTNSLILCNNGNCATVPAEIGYYVAREGKGIIHCTSVNACSYSNAKSMVKYVNAGEDKSINAIIECSKGKCYGKKAKEGYYLTYNVSLLIQCSSSASCTEFTPTVNYYDNADSTESNNSIIKCVQTSQSVSCGIEIANTGFYLSSQPGVLIRCKNDKCRTITIKDGIFRAALKGLVGGGSKRSDEIEDVEEGEDNGKSVTIPRDADESYGIIRCVSGKCQALSASEIAAIPICEFNNNKCYITLEYSMTKSSTTSIAAGNICTNGDRSVFYFATDTVVVKPNVIAGVTATYVYTTTNSNCIEVNDSYSNMYFTVGSNIYLLNQGSVLQFYETGYYFINTVKNVLVSGNDIDAYNNENVKLYKCNGSGCRIQDKPDSVTYYADVNKRILKFNVNSDSYSFAYEKDITCIFANNKCTPNADLKDQEFCITYKGELVLARTDIKNRETGECYKATNINSNIFGYSQYLYSMNLNAAEMVDETGYYIVSLSTNSTVVSKNYKSKNSGLVLYGCQLSSCKIYEPDESTYYYDAQAKTLLRYRNGSWSTPSTSGYAYISLNPADANIYRFTKNLEEYKINGVANNGYYYTVDNEMYQCDGDGECVEIDNTGYYFTNAGEIYHCIHDSEEVEPTECTKQACISGQYYYIDEAYYRCEVSSVLVPVVSRYCSYNENVIMNFPLVLTEELPDKIKQAVEGIEKNNNSTAIIKSRGKNYLESVSAIFTNCTYSVEETKATFDMLCVNNYVSVNEEDEVKICSVEQLGYVQCVEDETNPEKCKVSGALSFLRPSLSTILMIALSLLVYTFW